MKILTTRPGYLYLTIVLLVGALALIATLSLLLLSWSAEQNANRQTYSSEALELARSCLDTGILRIRTLPNYRGDEKLTLTKGTCDILPIVGNDADGYALCSRGTSGGVSRMLTAVLNELFPAARISKYREITNASECATIP